MTQTPADSKLCECKRPVIVTDDTYCFKCHKPTPKSEDSSD